MPTTEVTIAPQDGYVQISNGEKGGSALHIKGGKVHFHQSAAAPPINALQMDEIDNGNRRFVYHGLGTELLFAKAVEVSTKLTVTAFKEG